MLKKKLVQKDKQKEANNTNTNNNNNINNTKNNNSNPNHAKKSLATLRLQKDLLQLKQSSISFVQLSFPLQSSIQSIIVSISPQPTSFYHQCIIKFSLQFPDTYPMDPPKLLCLNKIYHPNINYNGKVCLPLVRQDYSPMVSLVSIICGLIFILDYPDGDDALNVEIGDLMKKDYQMFKKIVRYTVEGRAHANKQYDRVKKDKN